ncbi:MAG: WD40 repeat domain-containing protein [Cryomorphaceae bacterium]
MQAKRVATLKAHVAPLYALARGRSAETLFSAGGDRVVAEWDLDKAATLPFGIRTEATIYSLLNIDDRILIIGTNRGSMHVVDLETSQEIRHLKLHDQGVFHLVYCAKHKRVYAGSADGSLSVWEADQWSLLWHLRPGRGKIRRIALDASEEKVAVACGDGSILVLETENNRERYRIDGHEEGANSVAFLPNGNLISGGKDAHLRIWDAENHFILLTQVPAHNFAIYDILIAPNGKWLATASRDKTVKLWDIDLKEKPVRLDRKMYEGHTHSVNCLCFLEGPNLLASCSDDRSICLWEISA